jgi:hypothetical protein
MARGGYDKHFAARVLADAALTTDKVAAKKHSVTERTIGNYRARMAGDKELSELFNSLQTERTVKWAAQIPASISRAMAFLDRCATECNPQIPEQVEQVNAYLNTLLEAQAMQEYLARRFAPADELPTIVNPHQLPPAGDAHAAGG